MLQKQKGFTLIELMIVVAIIGILAAVAIPGFMSYIKNSKTSEAKTNLDAIKKGALTYYEAEHYGSDGMTATSKQYPQSESTAVIIGVTPSETTVGVKQSPTDFNGDDGFGKLPWKDLNFVLTSPFYYAYAYASNGYTAKDGETAAKYEQSHFRATACASLNTTQDSIFAVNGYSDGSTSPVIESTDKTNDCGKATAPTKDPE